MNMTKPYLNALPKGYQLKNYRIKTVLGAGSFSFLYLADDLTYNRQVAIKEYFPCEIAVRNNQQMVVPKILGDVERFEFGLQNFFCEAKAQTKINHHSIGFLIYDMFKFNGTAYIVMKFEKGRTLQQALDEEHSIYCEGCMGFNTNLTKKQKESLREKYKVNEKELRLLLSPLLDGVEALHKKNLTHGFIVPYNYYR